MNGRLTFRTDNPGVAALTYIQLLSGRLKTSQPKTLTVEGLRLSVRGGIFRWVSNWNLLAPVTSATIEAIPQEQHVTVWYEIRVTQMIVMCSISSLLAIPMAFFASEWGAAVFWLAVVWIWLFGFNYLIMARRMKSVFHKVARQATIRTSDTGVPVSRHPTGEPLG